MTGYIAPGAAQAAATSIFAGQGQRRRGGSPKRTWARFGGLLLAVVGLTVFAIGTYIPAKAWLGQRLLTAAFAEAQAKSLATKPWAWADFAPVARIHAPRIGADAIALNASTGAAMAWGPGAVPGLDQPGGGLVAFAGHRDTHFSFLGDLRPGDEVRVEALDGVTRTYQITGGAVVDSRKWRFPTAGDGLLLLTCWPLNAQTPGPLRLVITAEPVSTARSHATEPS